MVQSWFNSDGLQLKFGPDKATVGRGGEPRDNGSLRVVEVKIDLTTLGTAAAIIDDNIFFPKNVRIEEVEIVAETAATSSGSAVLNVGLQRLDRSTQLDYDGLIAALAVTAYDAAGEKNVIRVGSTGAGALIGTTTTQPCYITADYDTAAFTAGVVIVRIRYYGV